MLTVSCVLRSGGGYDQSWVAKLQRGVARNLTIPHRFIAFSDCEVPCERIPLKHDWPGWWSKLEIFSFKDFDGGHLYLDLDTVVCNNIDGVVNLPMAFGMLQNFHNPDYVGSGVMWFRDSDSVPTKVYDKFRKMPECYIQHHDRVKVGSHLGDQAFVHDVMKDEVEFIQDHFPFIRSYKYHCKSHLPQDTAIVCWHGPPRLHEVKADWIDKHWG